MADPLSISASIVALLQITATVIGYVTDVSGANADCARIRDEMTAIHPVLKALKEKVDEAVAQGTDDSFKTLKALGDPLDKFKKTMDSLEAKLEDHKGWRRVGDALVWPFRKSDVKEILDSIERYKGIFSLAMQNDHVYVPVSTERLIA